jgi:hypothetical protein
MEFEDHYVTCSLKHTMEHWLWCAVLWIILLCKIVLFLHGRKVGFLCNKDRERILFVLAHKFTIPFQSTDFHNNICELMTGDHPNYFLFLTIPTWRPFEYLRWERHHIDLMCVHQYGGKRLISYLLSSRLNFCTMSLQEAER